MSLCISVCLQLLVLLFVYVCIMKWIPYNLINKIINESHEKGNRNPFGMLSVVLVLSLCIPVSFLFFFLFFLILFCFSHSCINLSLCVLFQWVLEHVWGLRRSRFIFQRCSIWVSESQSCRPHVAAVVKSVYLSWSVSSCINSIFSGTGLFTQFNALYNTYDLAKDFMVGFWY